MRFRSSSKRTPNSWADRPLRLAALTVAVVAAVAGSRTPGWGQASPPPNPTITEAPALAVRMKDSTYLPATATVKLGQSVQFTNEDEAGHTVTSVDGSFDSGYLGKGDVWRTTFTRAGTFNFSDIYHPAMHGSIVVVVN